jgi:hypothetical protein
MQHLKRMAIQKVAFCPVSQNIRLIASKNYFRGTSPKTHVTLPNLSSFSSNIEQLYFYESSEGW